MLICSGLIEGREFRFLDEGAWVEGGFFSTFYGRATSVDDAIETMFTACVRRIENESSLLLRIEGRSFLVIKELNESRECDARLGSGFTFYQNSILQSLANRLVYFKNRYVWRADLVRLLE